MTSSVDEYTPSLGGAVSAVEVQGGSLIGGGEVAGGTDEAA